MNIFSTRSRGTRGILSNSGKSEIMIPVQDVLNRIRWDAEFARGEFELGYFDRVEQRVIVVPFREIDFPAESPWAFRLIDEEGRTHWIPIHRVREIYKNGQLIWHRKTVGKLQTR